MFEGVMGGGGYQVEPEIKLERGLESGLVCSAMAVQRLSRRNKMPSEVSEW